MYDDFARVYDRLMNDYDYNEYVLFIHNLLVSGGLSGKEGVDLACGSGEFTIRLSELGYRMRGVDLSAEMLNAARDKTRAKGMDLLYINQDIRELELPRKTDFAVMMCDGVNYITDGLNNAFMKINGSLNDGGLFIFDISSEYRLREIHGNNIFHYDGEDIIYIWHNEQDPVNKLVYMDLTFFEKVSVPNSGPLYRKFNENQVMRIYTAEEIKNILAKTGFSVCGVYGDVGKKVSDKSVRLLFVARKDRN